MWGSRHTAHNMHRSLRSERTQANAYLSQIIHTIDLRLWIKLATCKASLRLWCSQTSGSRRSYDNMHRGLRSEQTQKDPYLRRAIYALGSRLRKKLPSANLAWNSRTDNCGAQRAHIKICTETCALSEGTQLHVWDKISQLQS